MFNFCTKWYNTRGTLACIFSLLYDYVLQNLCFHKGGRYPFKIFYSFINTHTHSTHRSVTSSSCPLFLHRCSLPLPRAFSSVRKTSSKSSRKSSLIVKAAAEAKPDPGSDPKGLGNALPMEMDIDAIMKLLPHRYPFLLVDRILEIEQGSYAIGVKNVTINDNFFPGHFPQRPIMPGVLMVEAMAQVGGLIMLEGGGEGMI